MHVHPFGRMHVHVLLARVVTCTLRLVSLAPPSATTLVLVVEARAQVGYIPGAEQKKKRVVVVELSSALDFFPQESSRVYSLSL